MTKQYGRISNDLYGNDIASMHELAERYTRPLDGSLRFHLPDEIPISHNEQMAVHKLNKSLKFKTIHEKM